jgi:nucleotide-binding universal stress UspA family protein
MFERILVPLDGSTLGERGLPHACRIAQAFGAKVYLLRVLDWTGGAARPTTLDPFEWQIRKAEAETYLEEKATELRTSFIQVASQTLEGRPEERIIEYSQEHRIGLIVMSSHGQSGLSGWNVGGVVHQVVARARRSVMIVRAYQPADNPPNYKRILIPLDGSTRAEYALPVAESLASSCEGELLLAQVVQRPELSRRTPPSPEDLELATRLTERNRLEASHYLNELKGRLKARAEARLVVGESVSSELHTLAEQAGVDLVVMNAHGYTGMARWPYGGVVASFLAYGTTPLLVVQDLPEDRIEPTRAELAAREQGGR